MEFYPGFEVKKVTRVLRNKRQNMGDSVTKWEDMMEEAKSYSGLGTDKLYTQTTTMTKNIETKPTLGKEEKQIFRELLDEFGNWNESWIHYSNNPDVVEKPLNADEFAQDLANRYEIEEA
jgi:hypothetical protein